jgi:hypothetical protein
MQWRKAEHLSPFPRRAGDAASADHQQAVLDECCNNRVGRVKTIALGAICAPSKNFTENSCDLRIHVLWRPLNLQRRAGHPLGLPRRDRRRPWQTCDNEVERGGNEEVTGMPQRARQVSPQAQRQHQRRQSRRAGGHTNGKGRQLRSRLLRRYLVVRARARRQSRLFPDRAAHLRLAQHLLRALSDEHGLVGMDLESRRSGPTDTAGKLVPCRPAPGRCQSEVISPRLMSSAGKTRGVRRSRSRQVTSCRSFRLGCVTAKSEKSTERPSRSGVQHMGPTT